MMSFQQFSKKLRAENLAELEFLYQEIFNNRIYHPDFIQLNANDVVFDVGANIGVFAYYCAMRDCSVYSFEPIPVLFAMLKENTRSFEKNYCFELGLSSKAQLLCFDYFPDYSIMSGSDQMDKKSRVKLLHKSILAQIPEKVSAVNQEVIQKLAHLKLKNCQKVMCQMTTISEQMRLLKLSQIDLLKIDVEGHEQAVIDGIEAGDWPKIKQLVVEIHTEDEAAILQKLDENFASIDLASDQDGLKLIYAYHNRGS